MSHVPRLRLADRRPRRTAAVAVFGLFTVVAACSSAATAEPTRTGPVNPAPPSTGVSVTPTATAPTPTTAATTVSTTTESTMVPPTTTVSTTTSQPAAPVLARRELGRSVEGRPITAIERGTKGGTVVVVIGVIHGDEDAGAAIVDRLEEVRRAGGHRPVAGAVDEPRRAGRRHAARTPTRSTSTATSRWAGARSASRATGSTPATGPASEPETQAIVAFLAAARAEPGDLVPPGPQPHRAGRGPGRRDPPPLRRADRAAHRAGHRRHVHRRRRGAGPAARCPSAVAFIVELGPTLTAPQADTHAQAVLAVAKL